MALIYLSYAIGGGILGYICFNLINKLNNLVPVDHSYVKVNYRYYDQDKELYITTDDPIKTLKDINENGLSYLEKYLGTIYATRIVSMSAYKTNSDIKSPFLVKIAQYMGINIDSTMDNKQIEYLINEHIKYSPPPPLLNTGYMEAKESFEKNKEY